MNNQLQLKPLFYAFLLLLILPNSVFLIATCWLGDDRPIVNIDYLLPLICFVANKKFIKVMGVVFFILVFFIDILLIVLQHFPSFNFKDSFFLLSFIFLGLKKFLIYATAFICLLAIEITVSWKLAKKITFSNLGLLFFILLLVNVGYHFMAQAKGENTTFYSTSLVGSNTVYFIQNQEKSFANLLGGDKLLATPYQHATNPWTKAIAEGRPLNDKLFLVVNESWGSPLNHAIQEDVLKGLKSKANYFEYFEQGEFSFRGFTVEGELRELCQLYPTTLNMYSIKTGFQNCLPHKLNALGYKTHSIHGAEGVYYAASQWYPKAGFTYRDFQKDIGIKSHCVAFDAICDWDMFPVLKKAFKTDKKVFNYWLTISSHYSYYVKDIHNKRFQCSAYNLPEDGDACHSFMLQAQFFDYIAELVTAPEVRGVEVIIVGDHPPPLFKASEIALFKTKEMKDGKVGWVHFKIKDKLSDDIK